MGRNPFDKSQKSDTESNEQIAPPPGSDTPEGDATSTETSTPPERSHIEGIPTADWQPKPRKQDTRKRSKSRKVPLLPEIRKRLLAHIEQLGVPGYELVRYLLEYGLDEVDAGRLVFEAQLAEGGLTLYPEEKRRNNRRRTSRMVDAVYRNIPDETWDRVKDLASAYPIWQIANKMLEYGMDQIESGKLQLRPKPSGTKTLFP
jgi:hypothetical protein